MTNMHTEMGRLRTNMGIHPMGLQWHLKQGGVFNTPEAVLVRSDEGLGTVGENFGLYNKRSICTSNNIFIDRLYGYYQIGVVIEEAREEIKCIGVRRMRF